MHLLNFPLLRHPRCVLYSHLPVFCLYECFNIKSIVGSLFFFFFFALGGGVCGAGWSNAPRPCALHSWLLLSFDKFFPLFYFILFIFLLFFSIAKYLALLHNPPPDFSPINPSTRSFLSRLLYLYCTLSSGLSPPRSSSL